MLLLNSIGVYLLFALGAVAQVCRDGVPSFPCGNFASTTGAMCRSATVTLPIGEAGCCEVNNPPKNAPKCAASQAELERLAGSSPRSAASVQGDVNSNAESSGIPPRPPGDKPPDAQTSNAARAVGNTQELGEISVTPQEVETQSRSFVGLSLGFLAGGSIYPECPVHVKMCYRVQCGTVNYDNNPLQCLRDSRCCYDYRLAFMRNIFGPQFFSGVPVCYYGPTSKQWTYITNFFQPWSAWYTEFILNAFDGIFNTNAFSFGGNFACEFTAGRKAYPVGYKSELECNLVSGCWDDNLPPGLQCFMPADFISQLFGQDIIYPSLFTNDPSETQCSSNWFDFGPKAYSRLPCNIEPRPSSVVQLFSWCNTQDCCLNYASLSATERLILQAFSGGGTNTFNPSVPVNPFNPGFGNPFNQFNPNPQPPTTPNNPALFAYLLGDQTDDLEDLFCPYRSYFSSSLFPDFDDDTEGCCDIPDCYHKKELVGGGPPVPPSAQWGQWGPCSAVQCGTFGTRTRQCLVGGQPRPGFCPGQDSQQCQAPACQAQWGQWGPCSAVQCGTFGTRTRQCLSGGQPRPGFCPGQNSQQCRAPACQQGVWGDWFLVSQCSAPCGGGTGTHERHCFRGSQRVDPVNCPGGSQAGFSTRPCNIRPCVIQYRWSGLVRIEPCSVTCGTGTVSLSQRCLGQNNQVVANRLCPGQPQTATRPCSRPACPRTAIWTQWVQSGRCGVTCGNTGLQRETRECRYSNSNTPASATECPADQYGNAVERNVPCSAPACDVYYYLDWFAINCRRIGGRYCVGQSFVTQEKKCFRRVGNTFVEEPSCTLTRQVPCTPQVCPPGQ